MKPLFALMALVVGACQPTSPPVGQRISDPLPALFDLLDTDGSGGLSVDELRCTEPEDLLARLDTDGDGAVSPDELRADLAAWPEDLSRTARHAPLEAAGHRKGPPKAGARESGPPKTGAREP